MVLHSANQEPTPLPPLLPPHAGSLARSLSDRTSGQESMHAWPPVYFLDGRMGRFQCRFLRILRYASSRWRRDNHLIMTTCNQYYFSTFRVVKESYWSSIDSTRLRECRYLEARCMHGGVKVILNYFCTAVVCVYSSKQIPLLGPEANNLSFKTATLRSLNATLVRCIRGLCVNFTSAAVECMWFCKEKTLNFVTRCLLVALDEYSNMRRIREPSYWWILSLIFLTLLKHMDCHPGKYLQHCLSFADCVCSVGAVSHLFYFIYQGQKRLFITA